jgi:excisionase family DNA binding protein
LDSRTFLGRDKPRATAHDHVLMHATYSPELLRIPEAAERLNVSRASVYRWVVEGRLPAVQLGGRGAPLRIPSAELERWLGQQMSTMGDRSFAADDLASGDSSFVDAGGMSPPRPQTPAERDGTSSDSEAVEPARLAGD